MMARPETERPGGNKKSGKRRCELLMFPQWRNSSDDCGVETDPLFHKLAEEITRLRAQLAEAEADKLAAMERVREAAANIFAGEFCLAAYSGEDAADAIRALDVSKIAQGVK